MSRSGVRNSKKQSKSGVGQDIKETSKVRRQVEESAAAVKKKISSREKVKAVEDTRKAKAEMAKETKEPAAQLSCSKGKMAGKVKSKQSDTSATVIQTAAERVTKEKQVKIPETSRSKENNVRNSSKEQENSSQTKISKGTKLDVESKKKLCEKDKPEVDVQEKQSKSEKKNISEVRFAGIKKEEDIIESIEAADFEMKTANIAGATEKPDQIKNLKDDSYDQTANEDFSILPDPVDDLKTDRKHENGTYNNRSVSNYQTEEEVGQGIGIDQEFTSKVDNEDIKDTVFKSDQNQSNISVKIDLSQSAYVAREIVNEIHESQLSASTLGAAVNSKLPVDPSKEDVVNAREKKKKKKKNNKKADGQKIEEQEEVIGVQTDTSVGDWQEKNTTVNLRPSNVGKKEINTVKEMCILEVPQVPEKEIEDTDMSVLELESNIVEAVHEPETLITAIEEIDIMDDYFNEEKESKIERNSDLAKQFTSDACSKSQSADTKSDSFALPNKDENNEEEIFVVKSRKGKKKKAKLEESQYFDTTDCLKTPEVKIETTEFEVENTDIPTSSVCKSLSVEEIANNNRDKESKQQSEEIAIENVDKGHDISKAEADIPVLKVLEVEAKEVEAKEVESSKPSKKEEIKPESVENEGDVFVVKSKRKKKKKKNVMEESVFESAIEGVEMEESEKSVYVEAVPSLNDFPAATDMETTSKAEIETAFEKKFDSNGITEEQPCSTTNSENSQSTEENEVLSEISKELSEEHLKNGESLKYEPTSWEEAAMGELDDVPDVDKEIVKESCNTVLEEIQENVAGSIELSSELSGEAVVSSTSDRSSEEKETETKAANSSERSSEERDTPAKPATQKSDGKNKKKKRKNKR